MTEILAIRQPVLVSRLMLLPNDAIRGLLTDKKKAPKGASFTRVQ